MMALGGFLAAWHCSAPTALLGRMMVLGTGERADGESVPTSPCEANKRSPVPANAQFQWEDGGK